MTIWMFFRVSECYDELKSISLKDKIPLYAITTDKKKAKIFKKSRKESRFICKKVDADSDEGKTYLKDCRGKILKYYKLKTFPTKEKNNRKNVKVLMTDFEMEELDSMIDTYGIVTWMPFVSPRVFKGQKIQSLLDRIDFIDCYKIARSADGLDDIEPYFVTGSEEYPWLQWTFDELAVFLLLYGEDLNIDTFIQAVKY